MGLPITQTYTNTWRDSYQPKLSQNTLGVFSTLSYTPHWMGFPPTQPKPTQDT